MGTGERGPARAGWQDTRARDADREHTVGLLNEAFVDGQLDALDRDDRVERALAAKTLDELHRLTADLQPDAVARRRRNPLVAAGALAATALVAAGAFVLLRPAEPEPAPPAPVVVQEEPAPSVEPAPTIETTQPVPEPEPEPEFSLTLRNLRQFRERYEATFSTTQTYGVDWRPDRATVQVPVRGTRPRVETWEYDGEKFVRVTDAERLTRSVLLVDLAGVDFAAMLDNVEVAKRTLNVPKARLDYILFDHLDFSYEEPEIDIYVSNKYDESGRLTTRPDGTVFQRWPYEG